MKGRARAPSSPESEESWTVDCPCGVNFDDGEEMVDCDECGVWVHTSCCRVLKGHTSYVCDKCKYKKKKESEESEVAQLLVELPSKTPPLEEKVFTLRTDLSIEERVHVQGVPGGDPSFFVGVSPVFSRQLWKSTGYVPKVFQFKYNEFPECSDDKMGARILFGDLGERLNSPDPPSANHEDQVEEEKLLDIDIPPAGEVQADGYYLSNENYSKREFKRESKRGHKLQEDDFANVYHQSKRRRDENGKGFTSKKRSKTYMLGDYHRTRIFNEAANSLKSSRTAAKTAKEFAYNNYTHGGDVVTNSYGLRGHGTQSFGSTFGEAGVGTERQAKSLAAKGAKRNPIPILCSRDNEGTNESHRSPNPISESVTDDISPQEAYYHRRQQEGGVRNKVPGNRIDQSVNGEIPRPKEQLNNGGYMEGKSSFHQPDSKEYLHRVPLNVLVRGKDQVEEAAKEEVDPSPRNRSISQDATTKPIHVGASLQPGKHHASEEASSLSKQRGLSQKQPAGVGPGMPNHRQPEPSLTTAVENTYERHDQVACVADDEHMEPCNVNLTKDVHADDSSHFSAEPDEQNDVKHQNAIPLTPSSTVQHALHLEANTTLWVPTGSSHCMAEDSIKLSPLSGQSGPSKSAEMSSPTFSGPGVDSRQSKHHGFTNMDSVSPPADRNPNPQPGTPFKVSVESPNKVYTPVALKGGDTLDVKSNSSSKYRSRVHEVKNVDPAKLFSTPEDMDNTMNLSSRRESKEPTKVLEGKTVGTGKSPAGRTTVHPKAHAQPILAAKHASQPISSLDSVEQGLMQSKRPFPTTMPNKTGLRNTQVVISSSHGSTLDAQLQGMDSTCNDEELALLLHQELNSSPRVSRVARFRQGGSMSQPLSTKRSAAAAVSSPFQKDTHTMLRRKTRDDTQLGEVACGFDDTYKNEMCGGPIRQDGGPHTADRDPGDSHRQPLHSTHMDLTRHLSPGPGGVMERYSDYSGLHDADDGDTKMSADNILTLPGLIEEILNEKGQSASYELICEELLPHWSKLRKPNGDRYAYSSHRQAVMDCLRNRSAWSHLIDRGPKTTLGRKRRRPESVAAAVDSESAEHISSPLTRGEDHTMGKLMNEAEVDGTVNWPLSDSNKDVDLSRTHEEVPKGKRKARRGRRLTSQSRGHGARAHHSNRVGERGSGVEDDLASPGSEDVASTSEDEIYVHRGVGGRHVGRHRGSSVDSEDDDDDDTDG